jgi:pilus assembly protein CpaB
MNRARMLRGLVGALMVAFVASGYVYRQLQKVQASGAGKAPKQVQVVVAAGPLKLGQRLTEKDLAFLEWPEGKQPPGSFLHREDCVGRALVNFLVENEVILEQELAPRQAGEGLPVTIPQGMRAVSVGVDDVVAVAGFVTPGTAVDVLVTGMGPDGPVTRTLLEHVRVLAVGQKLQTENGKPQTASVVTLLVTPEDGEKLTLAAADGKLHLALRNPVDGADVNPPFIRGSTLFWAMARPVAGRPAPAKPSCLAGPYTVQVIRGVNVEKQTFPEGRAK